MSAVAATGDVEAGPGRRRFDRSWQVTAGAGMTLLAALGIALSAGPGPLIAAVAALGALLSLALLWHRAAAVLVAHRELILLLVPIAALLVWLASTLGRLQTAAAFCSYDSGPVPPPPSCGPYGSSLLPLGQLPMLPLVGIVLSASAGLVLVADAVRVRLGLAPRQRAPWKLLTARDGKPAGFALRALAGVLLVGWAAFLAFSVTAAFIQADGFLSTALLLVVAAIATTILGVPLLIGSRMRLDRDKGTIAREQERQRFAAHLHDSVLQTLALVQRQAHDPMAVTRLARRQEYALRAWMAGEAELRSDTLVAALRDAVADIEDEDGIAIELTAIGDRPLDQAGEALVAAAREALRNAARHGDGASVVMFAEVSKDRVEVFVRDDGPGFALEEVPAERRGIRDAIVGRMAGAGGSATVESAPGEGTEVALRLSAGGSRR